MNKPLSFAILLVVPLLVLAGHGLALLNRPSHLDEIVAELGSIGRFQKDPVPNHAGTRLLFFETTERGYGAFLRELASGKRTLLFEQVEKGAGFGSLDANFLGWAPDDSCFAYGCNSNGWKIVIGEGQTGATQGMVPVDNYIQSAAWLTPQCLAIAGSDGVLYTLRKLDGQWLHPLRFKYFRDAGHQGMNRPIEGFTAWSDNSVVWLQGDSIWRCGVDSEVPENFFGTATTATMDAGIQNTGSTWYEMGYNASAPNTGLPVHGSTFTSQTQPDHAYAMAPDYTANNAVLIGPSVTNATLTLKTPTVCTKLSFLTSAGNGPVTIRYRVHHADDTLDAGTFVVPDWFADANAAFIANGRINGYPYSFEALNSGFPRLFSADVVLDPSASPVTDIDFAQVSGSGRAAIFAVSGATQEAFSPLLVTGYNADLIAEALPAGRFEQTKQTLLNRNHNDVDKHGQFVVQSLYDGPPAIWQYEPGSTLPRCVAPNVEKPFDYVKNSPVEQGVVTNAAGEIITYFLLAPLHATAGVKHPLVLAFLGIQERGYTWSHNHEAFANCGAYFLYLERHGGNDYQRGLTVYEALAPKLTIDTNNVWLYGDSFGVYPVYTLLAEKPDLWRGAILFSPGMLPDPTKVHNKRLFFDCGGSDGNLGERVIRFQDEAAKVGTPVTLLIHPGLGHVYRIPQLERARLREALILFGTK